MIKFRSFSSGSCGNCYFLGLYDGQVLLASVLVDAGVSFSSVKRTLATDGVNICKIDAMFISHDHWDHIHGIGSYCKKIACPVYAPSLLHRAVAAKPYTGKHYLPVRVDMPEGWVDIVPGLIRARRFEVPHDATLTMGYVLEFANPGSGLPSGAVFGPVSTAPSTTACPVSGCEWERFVIMTDLGSMTDEALELASAASTVVVESNYDPDMLARSPYPGELQDRISGGHGHLSNGRCAEAISAFMHEGLRNVFLCHLSENSNTPELALASSRPVVPDGVRLIALPRRTPSPMYIL